MGILVALQRSDGGRVRDWQRALVVLFYFLLYGEEVIPLPQVQNAWSTWVQGALLPPSGKRKASLTEALEACDRTPAMHRLRDTAHRVARVLALEDDSRDRLTRALVQCYRDEEMKPLADNLERAWKDADRRLRESTVRGMLEALSFQMRALANADAIGEDYWRWVGPAWRFMMSHPFPASLLPMPGTMDGVVDHIGHSLLTLFGMALSHRSKDWNGLSERLRPRGLYRHRLSSE